MDYLPGLVSVSFRSLSPVEIITLVKDAGLAMIEWGGDVHLPPGERAEARRLRSRCREAGIGISAYGSYYRINGAPGDEAEFTRVLETAVELGAPRLRVWAGEQASDATSAPLRRRMEEEARQLAGLAGKAGVKLCLEYHEHTVMDTPESARTFLDAVGHPFLRSYWQPLKGVEPAVHIAGIRALLPQLESIHVQQRRADGERRRLAEGLRWWRSLLRELQGREGRLPLLLEFVAGGRPEDFLEDAAVLKGLAEEDS
jgi:sugar phosphate isomerase/epimerase